MLKKWNYVDSTEYLFCIHLMQTTLLVPKTNLSALLPTSKIHQKGTATSSQEELCETPKSHSYVLNKENVSLTLNPEVPKECHYTVGRYADGAKGTPVSSLVFWGRDQIETSDNVYPPFFLAGVAKFVTGIIKLKSRMEGRLGGSDGWASAFGSGHDPRVLGSSPTLGSWLSEKPASPSPSASLPAHAFSLSLCISVSQMNK